MTLFRLFQRPCIGPIVTILLVATFLPHPVHSQATPSEKIESDDARVMRESTWEVQSASAASGGSYLYSTGEATLSINFSGPSLEVIYIAGPTLGTLAIEVDGTVLRTVITTAENTAYGQVAKIDYLTDEVHELKVYAQGAGVIAVDAFVMIEMRVLAIQTVAETAQIDLNNLPPDPRYPLCNPTADLQLISRTPTGDISPTMDSFMPIFSGDGRYISYLSRDPNAQGQRTVDIMRYDRVSCTSIYVNSIVLYTLYHQIGCPCVQPFPDQLISYDFSANGRYVVFNTRATLAPNDTTVCYHQPIPFSPQEPIPCRDLYRHDILTGEVVLVSFWESGTQHTDLQAQPKISADGNVVFYHYFNVFSHDVSTGITHRFGDPSFNSMQTDGDGRHLAFASENPYVVGNDTNSRADVFRHDLQLGTVRASVASDGTEGNANSGLPMISDNGQLVAYYSDATNLVAHDTNGFSDVFVRDFQTNTTSRVSVATDGTEGNGNSETVAVSPDGRYVTFSSTATNLTPGDTNGAMDYFVHDRERNTTTRLFDNTAGLGVQPSRDARAILLVTNENNLVPDDNNNRYDAFIRLVGPQPDKLALWNSGTGQIGLLNSQHTPPPALDITIFAPGPPVTGQLVMGDWDGDGEKSPGIYAASGVFYYTNDNTELASWSAVWLGLAGRPAVAGRFDNTVNHDCIGAVDSANFPPYGTAFALYFTCDLTHNTAPALTFQWISVLLPDAGGFSGTHQFSAGDFDGDGVDSIAVRRGPFIAFTNDAPTILAANFPLAQYFGAPATTDEGTFVVGDWDGSGADSFGLFYQSGVFHWRDDLDWNSQTYFNQQVGQLLGIAGIHATAWH